MSLPVRETVTAPVPTAETAPNDVVLDVYDLEAVQDLDLLQLQGQDVLNVVGSDGDDQAQNVDVRADNVLDKARDAPDNSVPDMHDAVQQQRIQHGLDFMQKHVQDCACDPKCVVANLEKYARSFCLMSERDRSNAVKSMLFALTAGPDKSNDLRDVPDNARRKERLEKEGRRFATTYYALQGQRVCRPVFAAAVQVHPRTISRYARDVSLASTLELADGSNRGNRQDCLSPQSVIAIAFLKRFGDLNAMPCPTGRGSTDESAVRYLPSSMTVDDVYKNYEEQWETISPCVLDRNGKPPPQPLFKPSFKKVWRERVPYLRFCRKGSDFCDTCTHLSHSIQTATCAETMNCLKLTQEVHRGHAASEFLKYKTMMFMAGEMNTPPTIHLVFDFAEKILLPHLLRQPGQLHFVTGLKLDLFGVHSSNRKRTYIFCLPEGHWPGGKTANEVGSMLYHVIQMHRQDYRFQNCRRLSLHADNCGGQNKNRSMVWFFALLVILGEFDNIELYFLAAGHTKNRCDAAFGFTKRKLKQRTFVCPSEMMDTIDESSTANSAIRSNDVRFLR